MAITLKEMPMGTDHFGVFHILLGSTLCIESKRKSGLKVESASLSVLMDNCRTRCFLLFCEELHLIIEMRCSVVADAVL